MSHTSKLSGRVAVRLQVAHQESEHILYIPHQTDIPESMEETKIFTGVIIPHQHRHPRIHVHVHSPDKHSHMQVTEEARKRSGSTVDAASQKLQDAKEYAQQTAETGQQQGESAWQKVKDKVTESVDKVMLHHSLGRSCLRHLLICMHSCRRQLSTRLPAL